MKLFNTSIITFALAVIIFGFIQADLTFADPDTFYHAKMSEMLRDNGAFTQFPWLTMTDLQYSYTNHHFLYHLILIPFVTLFGAVLGIKVASILFSSLAIAGVYLFLKKLKAKGALWYALILLTSAPFIFRLNLGKAQPLALLLLLLALYFILHRKHLSLIIVSFFYVWLYAGWVILPALALIYVIVNQFLLGHRNNFSVVEKIKPKTSRQNIFLLFSVLVGSLAGIFFNPYFPHNISFYWQQVVKIGLVNYQNVIGVGGEWYPYVFSNLISDAVLFFSVFIFGLLIFITTIRRQKTNSWFFMIVSILFLVLTLKSRRNVEYLIPFGIIFSALSITASGFLERIKKLKIRYAVGGVLLIVFTSSAFVDIAKTKKSYANSFAVNKFASAAQWLEGNTPKDSIVFHSDWDEFPFLFFNNTHNRYLVGLDPTFAFIYDPHLHDKWVALTTGQQVDEMHALIKDVFQASYVFVDINDNINFDNNLDKNFYFKLVFEGEQARIYEVLE